jgi:hypothetical protein
LVTREHRGEDPQWENNTEWIFIVIVFTVYFLLFIF